MFDIIIHSNSSLQEKIDELKKITTDPAFLNILIHPVPFLNNIVPFAREVFRELPPDSEMTFGPSNDARVFFIRLFSKFKYNSSDPQFLRTVELLFETVYELIATENIFNRYLSLKILFPLLDSEVKISISEHIRCITSFFKSELPLADGLDSSRYEIGFFAVAEALGYLKQFQEKYKLSAEYYEEILGLLAGALRLYFTQKMIEKFCLNKKLVCEFYSMGVNMMQFVKLVNIHPNHFIIAIIPELCYTLANISPSDCYALRSNILDTIIEMLVARKSSVQNLERYFLKNAYLQTDHPPLIVKNIGFLGELMKEFGSNMSKMVYFEFDQRIREYIPTTKSVGIIKACIRALTINASTAIKTAMDSNETKMLHHRQIKIAYRIYKLLHLPVKKEDMGEETELSILFIEYLRVVIKSIAMLPAQAKLLDREQILILANLLCFPLTRELGNNELFVAYNELPVECLEKIVMCIAEDLFTKYHSQAYTWSALQNIPEINCILIKMANQLIYEDIMNGRFRTQDFYQKTMPVAYGFFKLDKKYIKPEFTEYFSVIYDSLLHLPVSGEGLTFREAVELINMMFMEVKTSEIAYTGLYFIYNFFEISVEELYNAYTLTFDGVYLECLFNIPVSLNLLVTKYAVLLSPMAAGLRLGRRTREIVIKYIEYVIEFDNEDGQMDDLLQDIYELMQEYGSDTCLSKGINVFSRISNRHRDSLTTGRQRGHKVADCEYSRTTVEVVEETEKEGKFVEESSYRIEDIEQVLQVKKVKDEGNQDNKKRIEMPSDRIRRLNIGLLTGFEFYYEQDKRRNRVLGSKSRILRACESDLKTVDAGFTEKTRDTLGEYLFELLGGDTPTLTEQTFVYQTATDIVFSLLLYQERTHGQELRIEQLLNRFVEECEVKSIRILSDSIPDGLVYAPESTLKLLAFMRETVKPVIFSEVMLRVVCTLIDFVYSSDDLKKNRSLDSLLTLISSDYFPFVILQDYNYSSESQKGCSSDTVLSSANQNSFNSLSSATLIANILTAIFFKLRNCTSFRIYLLCLTTATQLLFKTGIEGRTVFESLLKRTVRSDAPYLRAFCTEIIFFFDLPCALDPLPEIDRRCISRILTAPRNALVRIPNLPAVIDSFLRSIDKRDIVSIQCYLAFLHKIAFPRDFFNDLLVPAKKYLPAIAVLEGFSSADARRRFVENVNRNGNFQSQNPSSFRIFRNLFFNCAVAPNIKANFIEVYASQTTEHRFIILEILLNALDYDLPSFDFLVTKLAELPLTRCASLITLDPRGTAIFNVLASRLYAQPAALKDSLLMYLIEHIHSDLVYEFMDLCIHIDQEITNILNNFLNDFLNNNHVYRDQILYSRRAYNILRYLKNRKCRFNDNKAVLLVYRDLHNYENGIESLVNWYFKNFTIEDIELLYRIDNAFVITSESLLTKLTLIESTSTRSWMLQCLKKQCGIDNTAFLKRCVAFYYRSKGMPVGDLMLQNRFIGPEGQIYLDNLNIPDNLERLEEIGFHIGNETIESSTSSIFIEESSDAVVYKERQQVEEESKSNPNSPQEITRTESTSYFRDNRNSVAQAAEQENIKMHTAQPNIDLLDISFLLPYFKDNIGLVIELFCDLRIYSHELLIHCREAATTNFSYRFAALFYLCLFDPAPEYFECIFKLNYQERKYVLQSLQLLLEKSGQEPFINQIKTVLRSEMRFRTSEHILLPFLRTNTRILENKEVLLEVAVLIHRLARMGTLRRELFDALEQPIADLGELGDNFKGEINTIITRWEILNNKHLSMFVDTGMPLYDRIAIQNMQVPLVLDLIKRDLFYETSQIKDMSETEAGCFVDKQKEAIQKTTVKDKETYSLLNNIIKGHYALQFNRELAVSIFLHYPEYILTKDLMLWLRIPLCNLETPDNQMTALELFCDCFVSNAFGNIETIPVEFQRILFIPDQSIAHFIKSVVRSNSHPKRLSSVLPLLIKHSPTVMTALLSELIVDGGLCYPPLFESLPFLFEYCTPETAVGLCMRRPSNMPIETFELNTLHLFKVFPSAVEVLKKEFFSGLVSRNRITRECYLDLLISFSPTGIFNLIQFIILFDYTGISEYQIEYFIAILLFNSLINSKKLPKTPNITVSIENKTSQDIEVFYSPRVNDGKEEVKAYSDIGTRNNVFGITPDSIYLLNDKEPIILSILTALFRAVAPENLNRLYQMYADAFDCHLRIRIPFIKAFVSAGLSIGDLYYNPHRPSPKYYQLMDRQMYLGLMKSIGGIREVKQLIGVTPTDNKDVYLEVVKKIESRQASYSMNDVCFIEKELHRIFSENGIYETGYTGKHNNFSLTCNMHLTRGIDLKSPDSPFYSDLDIFSLFDAIDEKFISILDALTSEKSPSPEKVISSYVLNEVKSLLTALSSMFHIPRNTSLFPRLLLYCTLCSEIIESSIIFKDNLTESIYGRFRMWMSRYPSNYASLLDWNLFFRWRTFIFSRSVSMVCDNDRKKISSELCRLNCIYASKLFHEKLYARASSILNEVSSITTVEINQNLQRILLDLECLYGQKEYNTMFSLINSLNIAKFSNEEKSRLYYWAYKALKRMGKNADAEKYGSLSRKLFEILENKKEDLEILRAGMKNKEKSIDDNFSSTGFFNLFATTSPNVEQAYLEKLIEIINEVSVENSRPYVVELIRIGASQVDFEKISHQKLYYFIPQIKNPDFLFAKNPMLKKSAESIKYFEEKALKMQGVADSVARMDKIKELIEKSINNKQEKEGIEQQHGNKTAENKEFKVAFVEPDNSNLSFESIGQIEELASSYFGAKLNSITSAPPSFSVHFFDGIPLLGEFTCFRKKYDDLKIMEYVEASPDGLFCVRNTDGSLSVIVVHKDDTRKTCESISHVLTDSKPWTVYQQFMSLMGFSISLAHGLDKSKFSYNSITTVSGNASALSFSVHNSFDFSIESLWMTNISRKAIPLHSILTSHLKKLLTCQDAFKKGRKLSLLCDSISQWSYTIWNELCFYFSDYNDLFSFKRNFISSYSSIICLQHIINISSISYDSLFVDISGNVHVSLIDPTQKQFYLRPGVQRIFGSEGINGPLSIMMNDVLRALDESHFEMSDVFGVEMRKSIHKDSYSEQLENKKNIETSTVTVIIGEMVDPKTALNIEISEMPWI